MSAITNAAALINDSTIIKPQMLVKWLIHMATKVVVGGGSKSFKSWLLLLLAFCVAIGMDFLRWPTLKTKVLVINLELGPAFMKERLAVLMHHFGLQDLQNLDIWNLRGMTANPDALIAHIIKEAQGKGYGLIIIDPIYKLMNGRSENSASGVSALCHLLERIAEKTGAAVVYSHHFAKGNSKKKSAMDRLSGSGVFARDADTIITLTEHSEPDCYTVEMVLRNLPQQQSFVVEWDYPVMVEREDLDPEDVLIKEVEDEDDQGLLDIIKVRPQPTWEWEAKALALGLSRSTFFRIKRKLKDNGYVQFDFKTKLWSVVKTDGAGTAETIDTVDTIDTSNTGKVTAGGTAPGRATDTATGGTAGSPAGAVMTAGH